MRIVALLGFSSVVHAGALLVYGYLYPSEPQAAIASQTIQLQLKPTPQVVATVVPQSAVRLDNRTNKVLVTRSEQAEFSVASSRVSVDSTTPELVGEKNRRKPNINQPVVVKLQPETVPVAPVTVQDVSATLKIVSEQSADVAVVAEVLPTETVVTAKIEPLAKTSLIDDVAESAYQEKVDPFVSDVVVVAVGSERLPAGKGQAGSDRLAGLKSQLGEQLLYAFEQYFSYPLKARRKGWQGEVLLAVVVARNGEVSKVQLLSSSGYKTLDRAAIKSMNKVGKIDPTRWQLSLVDQPLQIEVPVAYQLVN
ncbi:MAG: TonB family protein [Halopseudomonas sp.]